MFIVIAEFFWIAIKWDDDDDDIINEKYKKKIKTIVMNPTK